jgi:hypothetical protein
MVLKAGKDKNIAQIYVSSGEGLLLHHNFAEDSTWQDRASMLALFSLPLPMPSWAPHPHDLPVVPSSKLLTY